MPFVPDPNLPQIPAADACRAAEIAPVTLKNLTRPTKADPHPALHVGEEEIVVRGKKTRFLFTLRRVYQMAIIRELSFVGIQPRRAGMLAFDFTDTLGDSLQPRGLGRLFPQGDTVLVWRAGEPAMIERAPVREGHGAIVKLPLNPLLARVHRALGLPDRLPEEEEVAHDHP